MATTTVPSTTTVIEAGVATEVLSSLGEEGGTTSGHDSPVTTDDTITSYDTTSYVAVLECGQGLNYLAKTDGLWGAA